MSSGPYIFGPFRLDADDRRLTREGEPVELGGRYLDALALLASEGGRLVTKDRFMDEVWRGVPVTDEALTQCIRSLRRALGDQAGAPRFIETVPRHGYRLIAPVSAGETANFAPAKRPAVRPDMQPIALDALAGALGGGTAGIAGGLAYLGGGLIEPGIGTASTLLVLISVNLLLGFVGGLAVAGGAALADQSGGVRMGRMIMGGAIGGLAVGAIGRMVGLDLFSLFFGREPGAITGALEGTMLGAATAFAFALAMRHDRRSAALRLLPAFAIGGATGAAMALLGGRLMAGSLAELAARFPESHLGIGGHGLSLPALVVATACEGALFSGCVSGAMIVARRMRTAG
jgi:DNA-binding winged helix-turn-helix (wHTH) protein